MQTQAVTYGRHAKFTDTEIYIISIGGIIEDIKRLAANKPMIKQFDEAQESLRGVKEHHNELYTQLKAKNAELNSSKEEEEKWRAEMDAAKAKHREESKLRAQYNKNPLAAKEKGTNPRRSGRALEWMRALDCGILGQGERALE